MGFARPHGHAQPFALDEATWRPPAWVLAFQDPLSPLQSGLSPEVQLAILLVVVVHEREEEKQRGL